MSGSLPLQLRAEESAVNQDHSSAEEVINKHAKCECVYMHASVCVYVHASVCVSPCLLSDRKRGSVS